MINVDKPKKRADELIDCLKDKGITFNIIDEDRAVKYLEKNNYLRTASYRRNFEKNQRGEKAGKYTNLDFAYLAELSSIDKQLREILLTMCIDVEHALKSKLISSVENNPHEDGYNIADAFFIKYPKVIEDIEKKSKAVFTENLIKKYFSFCCVYTDEFDENGCNIVSERIYKAFCPVWVLVELISFGDLLNLIYLYNSIYPDCPCEIPRYNELSPIKSLRNACAHNNCLLNNMGASKSTRPTGAVVSFVQKTGAFSPTEIQKKLSCRPTFEIITLLKYYSDFVSPNVKRRGIDTLKSFVFGRMFLHIDYFDSCNLIKTTFSFFKRILDNFE